MKHKLSKNILINKKGLIEIYFENKNVSNKTNSEIVISGNEEGFLSLSSLLIYHLNDLEESILVSDYPFIKSNLVFEIVVSEYQHPYSEGEIIFDKNRITWKISEDNLAIIATDIQSLAFFNDELHLDQYQNKNEISLYFVTDDAIS